MRRSRYKHVTLRKGELARAKPWQAMVRKEYLGCFADEEKAAKAVAKKLRRPKTSLLLRDQGTSGIGRPKTISLLPRDPSKEPKRSHRFVYWHAKGLKWQVKIGATFYGLFDKHDDALARATEETGLKKEDLLLRPDHVRRSLQGQRNAIAQHVSWFQHLYQAYADPKVVAYPGDLVDMTCRASQDSRILAHPNFIIPMILAKFGPHRTALHDAFLSVPKPDDDPSELKWTYLVIVAALRALSRINMRVMDPWYAGPGRKSTHHSGLVVYAHCSLKILAPCDEEPPHKKRRGGPNSSKRLVLGKDPRAFLIQPYTPELERALAKVRAFGLALVKVKPPNSLEEWSRAMSDMTSAVRSAPGIPKTTCYRYKWVVRAFWDYSRKRSGAKPGITWGVDAMVLMGIMVCKAFAHHDSQDYLPYMLDLSIVEI